MRRLLLVIFCCVGCCFAASAQLIPLDSAGRNPSYVHSIITRSTKIVDALQLTDKAMYANVLNIVCNRYFKINDIDERFKDQPARDAELYKHHFEFAADLANYLDDHQIEQIKDGMTYGVVPKTYQAHLEMIPTLKEDEKLQILNWLKEAREFAIDAPDAKSKHAWFGKYKGRINNWLSKRGYNLDAERQAWYKRIEAAKKNK